MGRFVFSPPAGVPNSREKKVSKPTQFTDININSERSEDELYCDYKCRQWWVNRILRRYSKGRVVEGGTNTPNRKALRQQRKKRGSTKAKQI